MDSEEKLIGSDPIFGVSEFVAVFNQTVEMQYPSVKVVGELANFKINRGRWVYFDLKDDFASVKFFGSVNFLPGPLEDGLMLEVTGKPRLHPNFGFSINFNLIKVSGEGSIQKAKNLLAQKLLKEGLFDESRKREIPYPPSSIGVVTAEKSAGFSDFKKIINARWQNIAMKLIDVKVQGSDAPKQIVKAIKTLNELREPPEVLVILRGGGSVDDLASFSEESVVRAVASSRIPTLVAIGHEIDESLAELAADKRASTPSNAAELLVPDRQSEIKHLNSETKRLVYLLNQNIELAMQELKYKKSTLKDAVSMLRSVAVNELEVKKELLSILDPKAPLKRGYALVSANKTRIISVNQLKSEQGITVELQDGIIKAQTKEVSKYE